MAQENIFLVVSYDIPDNKRRARVIRILHNHGAERVQYSVFECYCTARTLEVMTELLQRTCHESEDTIRIYTLCASCRPRVTMMGKAAPIRTPGVRIY